eukprot:TRINITY_DN3238_c0_g1_i3.p1 TRINITY_DN3238_c0_g1~~TRINITY_DN3238_c0_g1_i3.p1  ORF type:complete len:307 (-),score=-16.11 TRINITY_DN3238_c0_g1_i3:2-922(-)
MDDKSVNYAEDRYKEIKSEVEKMLTKIGYKVKKIPFVPMSGWKGDNLKDKSTNMPWYKGWSVKIKKEKIEGFTLIEALEKVAKPPKRQSKKPFRMPVSGVYKINGVGDVITGRIEQGKLVPDVNVRFYPSGVKGKAFSIEMHHKQVKKAVHGDNVGVNVKGLKKENMPKVGDVMCNDDEDDPKPPKQAAEFTALVFVQDHPGQLKCAKKQNDEYKGGFTPSIHIRTAKAPCQMLEIKWKSGKSTNNQKVECPPYIEAGDQAEVVFAPKMPFVVCPFDECKPLGRVAAMDSNSLIMLGKVVSVVHKS